MAKLQNATRIFGSATIDTFLFVNGNIASTSTNSGALQVVGGVGIGGAVYIGQTSYINNSQILTSSTFGQFITSGVSSINAGTDTAINTSTGAVTIWNTSTLQSITNRGNSTTNVVLIANTSSSTSTTTGALVVSGGVGIYGGLVVGGPTTATTLMLINTLGSTTTVSNLLSSTLQVYGSAGINNGLLVNGITTVTNATASNTTNTGALQVYGGVGVGGSVNIGGSLSAISKSFVINHPTKEGSRLRYGSLEGPENGVYVRGRLTDGNTINLPDYWTKLVDPDSITVQITPIGGHLKLYVDSANINQVIIKNDGFLSSRIDCYYIIFAERNDIPPLVVEE